MRWDKRRYDAIREVNTIRYDDAKISKDWLRIEIKILSEILKLVLMNIMMTMAQQSFL